MPNEVLQSMEEEIVERYSTRLKELCLEKGLNQILDIIDEAKDSYNKMY